MPTSRRSRHRSRTSPPGSGEGAVMTRRNIARTMTAVAIAGTVGATSLVGVHAWSQPSETLVYAVYDGQDTASQVFKTMKSAQADTGERIESYAVVSKDTKGKVRVRDQ